jgi:hypothetical protein
VKHGDDCVEPKIVLAQRAVTPTFEHMCHQVRIFKDSTRVFESNTKSVQTCKTCPQTCFLRQICSYLLMSSTRDTAPELSNSSDVAEVIEQIFLWLDPQSIVRATGVCSFWKNFIAGSMPLLRKIYKLPKTIEGNSNPHFEKLLEAA